jgi:hypothetical protein
MGDDMQGANGRDAGKKARALLESYLFESGFYTPEMTPRGRWVAEVFDCRGEEFASEYFETSGHLDPGVAVRLHDTCAALYGERSSIGEAHNAWDEWESVLKEFTEAYGLAFAQFCVDSDRETNGRDRPPSPSEEEFRNNQELEEMTREYVDSLLKEYRVVDLAH